MLRKTVSAAILISIISLSPAYAEKGGITPYGDYCDECTTYGKCKNPLTMKQAITSIEQYYKEKGYSVKNHRQKGRFVEAEIYNENKLIDKVLFDRHTGRIRSVF
jgi:hypothetical protein